MVFSRPMPRYRGPQYPTHLEVLESPDLLRRHVPRRWKRCAELAGGLAICLSATRMMHGQEAAADERGNVSHAQPRAVSGQNPDENRLPERKPRCMTLTVGAGDDATTESSEETVLNLIKAVLHKSKVNAKEYHGKSKQLGTEITFWSQTDGKVSLKRVDPATPALRWGIDRFDAKKRVGIVVVPYSDEFLARFQVKSSGTEQTGKTVVSQGKTAPAYIGIFENEIAGADCEQGRKRKRRARVEAKRLLRQQVQDFVNWLKAQGVI